MKERGPYNKTRCLHAHARHAPYGRRRHFLFIARSPGAGPGPVADWLDAKLPMLIMSYQPNFISRNQDARCFLSCFRYFLMQVCSSNVCLEIAGTLTQWQSLLPSSLGINQPVGIGFGSFGFGRSTSFCFSSSPFPALLDQTPRPRLCPSSIALF